MPLANGAEISVLADRNTSGPFHRLVRKDSDTLLVTFSSMDTPPNRFRPYRVPASLPYSNLFVNCPSNEWYLGDIPGLGRCPEETLDSLGRLVDRSGCRRVVTYGGSMGGFGAVLFGFGLGADLIVAHGGESIIGLRGSHSGREINDPILLTRARKAVRSWRHSGPRFRGELHAFFGETDIQDGIHAKYLHKLTGVRPKSVRGAAHDVERFIDETYGLARHLREIVSGQGARFVAAMCGPFPDVRELAWAYRRRVLGRAAESGALIAESDWPGAYMIKLGDALAKDDVEGALAIVEAAVVRRPDFEYFHYALIVLLLAQDARREGRRDPLGLVMRRSFIPKDLATKGSRRCLLQTLSVFGSYHDRLVIALDQNGLRDAGAAAAERACRRFPGDERLWSLRNRIASRYAES